MNNLLPITLWCITGILLLLLAYHVHQKGNPELMSVIRNRLRKPQRLIRHSQLPADIDILVLGAGVSGLHAATVLAASGHRVVVLERHDRVGGGLHSWTTPQRSVFDTGCHGVGLWDRNKGYLEALTHPAVGPPPTWDKVQGPDVAFFQDGTYWAYNGGTIEADLRTEFPGDHRALETYWALCHQVTRAARWWFLFRHLPRAAFLYRPYLALARRTVVDVLEKDCGIGRETGLFQILTARDGNFGLPPTEGSFFIHAGCALHYLQGSWFPKKGPGAVADWLCQTFQAWGGEVFVCAEVQGLVQGAGDARVKVRVNGINITARRVLSSIGVPQTLRLALPSLSLTPRVLGEKRNSHISVFVELYDKDLKGEPTRRLLPSGNLWIAKHKAFVSCPRAKGSNDATSPSPQVLQLIFEVSDDPRWLEICGGNDGCSPDRDTVAWYNQQKALYRREALSLLTLIDHRLRHKKLWIGTPSTNHRYLGRTSSYGLPSTTARFGLETLSPRGLSSVLGPAVVLTGQDVATVGVTGAWIASCLSLLSLLRPWGLIRAIWSNPKVWWRLGRALGGFPSRSSGPDSAA